MTDIATLSIQVKADGTAKVVKGLDDVKSAAIGAEGAAGNTSKTMKSLDSQLLKTAKAFGAFVSVGAVITALTSVTKQAAAFESAMREVSTLTNSIDMTKLTRQVEELSGQFGQDRITQANALYQVISAGAGTAAEAMDVLTVANQLAVGGVTDVSTAADGLTSALNAYGEEATAATDYSDAMFVAMKAGKTTIGELSENIGKLAPMAAQAGVSFDELLAATSAVTTTGLDTSMTMNSLRQVLANVIKPTSQARDAAEALGLQFDVAAIRTQGFTGFLADVVEKTGGSTTALSTLFGSVESLQAIMFLASQTGRTEFLKIMDDMKERSGATKEAFDKMSTTTEFLAGVLKQQLTTEMLNIGRMMLEVVNPAISFVVENFDTLKRVASDLGSVLLTGVIYKGLVALPGLLLAAKGALVGAAAATRAFTLALLANPLALVAKLLMVAGTALWVFRDKMVSVGDSSVSVGNLIKSTWQVVTGKFGGFIDSITGWLDGLLKYFNTDVGKSLNVAGDFFVGFFNNVVDATKTWVNTFIRLFDVLGNGIGIVIGAIAEKWETFWQYLVNLAKNGWEGLQAILNGDLSFTALQDQLEAGMQLPGQKVTEAMAEMWNEVSGRDYIGGAISNIEGFGAEVLETAVATQNLADATEEAGEVMNSTGAVAVNASTGVDTMGAAAAAAEASLASLLDVKDELSPFDEALTHTVERIDESFAQAWRGAFDSFKDFASSLKNAFLDLLAELAHQAITRPIIMSIGASFGIGDAAAAASGGMDLLSGASTGASVWSNLSGGISAFGSQMGDALVGVYDMVGSAAQWVADTTGSTMAQGVSDAAWSRGTELYNGTGMQALTDIGLNVGAGLLGGWAGTSLGESLFGREANSGWGAAIGGFAGSMTPLGPIGTMIGSAIGGMLDAAFGSSTSDKWVNYQYSDGSSTLTRDTGKPLSQDAAEAGVGIVQAISDAIGGSNASFEISGGRRSGLRLAGEIFGDDAEGFARAAFDLLVAEADQFSQSVRDMALSFEGTTENAVTFLQAWSALDEMIGTNSVEQAIADWDSLSQSMEEAGSNSNPYQSLIDGMRGLISEYDGTAESAMNLAQGMAVTRQAAYDMAIAILTLGDNIAQVAQDSADRIRESVLSPEELREMWTAQRDELSASLSSLVDPEAIAETVSQIASLNEQIFQSITSGGEEGVTQWLEQYIDSLNTQLANATSEADITALEEEINRINNLLESTGAESTVAELFAGYIEGVNSLAQDRLASLLTQLQDTQDALNAEIGTLMGAADIQSQAANDFSDAVYEFGRVIREFPERIVIDADSLRLAEVNA
jgi:TP901 family phage tail tape measure protein